MPEILELHNFTLTWCRSLADSGSDNILQTIRFLIDLQVSRNTSLWVMSPLHPDPLVLLPPQEILDTLCLNDCSGSGQCSKGVCLCAAGRTGADCGVSVAEVSQSKQNIWHDHNLSLKGPKSGKPRKPWTLRRPGSPLQVQWLELVELNTGETSI